MLFEVDEALEGGVPPDVLDRQPNRRQPRLGREGANIAIVSPGSETQTGGVYGEEGYVYQLFAPLPEFDGYRPALGAWIVGDTSAGLGIRETVGLVTDDGAAFVPHRIPSGGTS